MSLDVFPFVFASTTRGRHFYVDKSVKFPVVKCAVKIDVYWLAYVLDRKSEYQLDDLIRSYRIERFIKTIDPFVSAYDKVSFVFANSIFFRPVSSKAQISYHNLFSFQRTY